MPIASAGNWQRCSARFGRWRWARPYGPLPILRSYILGLLLTDVAYTLVDPRVRL
ncbi:MAG: hypothetical protein H6926_00190 [Chromatiales bacterium]|nr:hypothetical protein [Gammaproteobacteria bacterium]MCP5351600.1 hypothetical protein [Chromatiales bacterium]